MDPILDTSSVASVKYWSPDDWLNNSRVADNLGTSYSLGSGTSTSVSEAESLYVSITSGDGEPVERPVSIEPATHWPTTPILDAEDQRWLETYNVLRVSGLLPLAPFPATTTGQLVQYLAAGRRAVSMVRGLTYLSARAHGVVATPDGQYDHRYLNGYSNPFPVLSRRTTWSLGSLASWFEITYGITSVDLVMLSDNSLVVPTDESDESDESDELGRWKTFTNQLFNVTRGENEPKVQTTDVPLPYQGNLIWRAPKSTLAIASVASVFRQLALVRPILGGGCWYLLARERRSQLDVSWLQRLDAANHYYLREVDHTIPELSNRDWAKVMDRLNLPTDVVINGRW